MSTLKWAAYQTPDTLLDSTAGAASSTSLYAATTGSFVLSAEIDNSTLLYEYGDLELFLSGGVTCGAGSPSLDVFLLPNMSGNYAYAAGVQPGQSWADRSAQLVASAAITYVQVRGILLTPNKFKVALKNNMGVTWPSNTLCTAKLYRYSEQAV